MKLYRYEHAGRAHLGIGFNGLIVDAERLFEMSGERPPDVVMRADIKTICAAPDAVVMYLAEYLKQAKPVLSADGKTVFAPGSVRILPPIPNPGKFICIGLNYRDHCEEQKVEPPKNPVLFAKFANAVCGHKDRVLKSSVTEKLDFEGELGVIIGAGGKRLSRASALEHVFGYTIIHDVSARDVQRGDGQWLRAKSQDTFAPVGPCIVTADEIPNPQALSIRTRVNGQLMQDSNTSKMIFGVADLIAFITEGITLEPGDVISTGTPDGVGMHRKPPVFLQPGDRVDIEIESIGVLSNEIE
jgi:2-keto-4-pentenoate hydratase/2-oxohepta-3-ene-1,7-dioic acid hydratase in catechol pathway